MEIVVPMCKMLLENPYGDAQMQVSLRCFIRELCWSGSPRAHCTLKAGLTLPLLGSAMFYSFSFTGPLPMKSPF